MSPDDAEKEFRARLEPGSDWAEEALSESDFEWWAEIKRLALDWSDAPADRLISLEIDAGHQVLKRICDYCTPEIEDES